MKYISLIILLAISITTNAQSKKARIVMSNADMLERIVFETKDSIKLESLFANELSYVHSSGKIESRKEAIQSIIHNKSVYIAPDYFPFNYIEKGDSAIVKKRFKATEKKTDGTEMMLDITVTTVWIKEKGDWRLVRRAAVKN